MFHWMVAQNMFDRIWINLDMQAQPTMIDNKLEHLQ
jgi:hypothetical protein